MSATKAEGVALASPTVPAAASWFIGQASLPRYETVKLFGEDFAGYIEQLIPQIEQLVAARPADDVQAMVAMAAVGEAQRRLCIPERPGLAGEVERVKRLARSVAALRVHYELLMEASA